MLNEEILPLKNDEIADERKCGKYLSHMQGNFYKMWLVHVFSNDHIFFKNRSLKGNTTTNIRHLWKIRMLTFAVL